MKKHLYTQSQYPPHSRAAFTLIEMLVVIAIIVLLLSLIVPVTNKSLNRATRTKCLSNLRQISVATMTWATDHKGILPVAERQWPSFPHAIENYHDLFEELLGERDRIMFCPGKLRQARNPDTPQYDTIYTTYQYFNNPTPFQGSYSSNKPNMTDVSEYPSEAALWGCLTLINGSGVVLAHEVPAKSKPITGMNAVYLDGHGTWVEPENLEVYYTAMGAKYSWPNPEK